MTVDGIAIVGMACRFPGAPDLPNYWQNLLAGVDSVRRLSPAELREAGVPDTLIGRPDYVPAAAVIDDHDRFDARFFGYSPHEARLMDPQHRILLEVAWHALEDAGHAPGPEGPMTSVFAGAGGIVSSYLLHAAEALRGQTAGLAHLGNDRDFLAARLAYKLDLRGPAINVQSACSTSLVALHLACQNLLDGESDRALVGVSTVRVPHFAGYLAEKGHVNAPDGVCRPFDAAGQGTLFGSGVGAVLLRPVADALEAGDRIYAVIRATAINNDGGAKVSFTASSAEGQARCMHEALAFAEVAPASIGYVECHGTATPMGDPLEVQALTRAFSGAPHQSIAIGSVKSNFGHLEQSAGMAGLIKTALMLYHGALVPSLHFETPNPKIDFPRTPFRVQTARSAFARGDEPRRAAVNALGLGGTNAFAILEEAPVRSAAETGDGVQLLVLSAKDEVALTELGNAWREAISADGAPSLSGLCRTARLGRAHHGYRTAVVAGDRGGMATRLTEQPITGQRPKGGPGPKVFLFTGQGSQIAGMGRVLCRNHPVFRETWSRCAAYFDIDWDQVIDDPEQIRDTRNQQPALFVLQRSLCEMFRSWGLRPDIVLGHSIGELAAAVAAGVLDEADAARLVDARAQAMAELPFGGGMASLEIEPAALQPHLEHFRSVAVAAFNGPSRLVVSGEATALDSLLTRLEVGHRRLEVSHAFHSPLMAPVAAALEGVAASVRARVPHTPMISTLTGGEIDSMLDAAYWCDQLLEPVQFTAAMNTLSELERVTFVEIGPGKTLLDAGRRCLPGPGRGWLPTVSGDPVTSVLEALGSLFVAGHDPDWSALSPGTGPIVDAPGYPFQRERYWVDIAARSDADRHPVLDAEPGSWSLATFPYLDDHRVYGRAVLPTTLALEAAWSSAVRAGVSDPIVRRVFYGAALTLPDEGRLHVRLDRDAGSFSVWSGSDRDMTVTHLTAETGPGDPVRDSFDAEALRRRCPSALDPGLYYAWLWRAGLRYGQGFRGIRALAVGAGEAWSRIALPDHLDDDGYALHPAFLDAALHLFPALVPHYDFSEGAPEDLIYLPLELASFHLVRTGVREGVVWGRVRQPPEKPGAPMVVDIQIQGLDGRPVAAFSGLVLHELPPRNLEPVAPDPHALFLHEPVWRNRPLGTGRAPRAGTWVVFTGDDPLCPELIEAFDDCRVVRFGAQPAREGRHWVIRSDHEDDLSQVLEGLPEDCAGLVWAATLEGPREDRLDFLADLLALVRCLAGGIGPVSPLFLLTRGAWPRGGEPPVPVQAVVWGLGRSFSLEHPRRWGGLIDLGDATETTHRAVIDQLRSGDDEQQLRFNEGAREVVRLRQRAAAPPSELEIREDATYWIAGGLGGLGLRVARMLVARGARHLVLTNRSGPGPAARRLIDELASRGVVIETPRCDLTRREEVIRVADRIAAEMPPLRGVIHAAAALDDAMLDRMDWPRFEKVVAPKVLGAKNLHSATEHSTLDFFTLFSSVLGIWGAAGSANYAAANCFLDAFARWRRAGGLHAESFAWGPWSEVGMVADQDAAAEAAWKSRGTRRLSPEVGIAVLNRNLGGEVGVTAVTDTDWDVFGEQFGDRVPAIYDELIADRTDHGALDLSDRQSIIDRVARLVAAVLGFDASPSDSVPLGDLGLDSLLSVNLVNRLEATIGIAVPTAALLRGPSIAELVDSLFPDLGAQHQERATGWLVRPLIRPETELRLFCFPFAGGGTVTYRPWTEYLDPRIELVAVEPPGRQTRLGEEPIDDLDRFLAELIPEMIPLLDRPFAFFGHCLGGLTLYETARALMRVHGKTAAHLFVSGARPPQRLKTPGDFEVRLLELMANHPESNMLAPIHAQPEDVFISLIRLFQIPATDEMVENEELRALILPTVRAEFAMADAYKWKHREPLPIPITCFTGHEDLYVSREDAEAWAGLTCARYQLHYRDGAHFLVEDDEGFLLKVIARELLDPL